MRDARRWADRDDEDEAAANCQTASLAGLAAALVLVVLGRFLIHALRHEGQLEDRLMAGRLDCDATAVTAR